MNTDVSVKAQERVSLWIPKTLSKRVSWAEEELDLTRSEIFRKAISEFINKLERDAIDREVEGACKAYGARDRQLAKEWRAAEGPV